MKKYSRQKLAQAIPQLLKRHPKEKVVRLVAQELIKARSTHELPWLIREIASAFFVSTGKMTVQLETARPLSPHADTSIEGLIKKLTGATSIQLEKKINKKLLGGFKAETPTVEIDASLQTRLNSLPRYG